MAKLMNRKDFEELVRACKNYDAFTAYIDDGRQWAQAENNNRCCDKWFDEIIINYIDTSYRDGVPYTLKNKGTDTATELTKWLAEHEVEVEAETKRIWTEEEIKNYIQTNDTVLYGALKKLYDCQTADEQAAGYTNHYNGIGFNGVDSPILSSMAEFLKKTGFLTTKQKAIVRKKLVKYNKQLTKLANM